MPRQIKEQFLLRQEECTFLYRGDDGGTMQCQQRLLCVAPLRGITAGMNNDILSAVML